MSGATVKPGKLDVADSAALFPLVSLPWAFMLLRMHYDWDVGGFGSLAFIGLFLLRNAVLFPRKDSPAHHPANWKTRVLILGFLALFVGIIWLSPLIDKVYFGQLATLLITFFWIRDIWLTSLRAKGQLPEHETLFPRHRET